MNTYAFEQACAGIWIILSAFFAPELVRAAENVGENRDIVTAVDIVTYSAMFILATIIVWLSNKEIKKSLLHHQISTKILEKERDALEIRLAKRTSELVNTDRMKDAEIGRINKFGELSQGLFHDLMNPLTSISLYIESLATKNAIPKETREMVNKVVDSSKRMRSFMDSVKRCLGNGENISGSADMSKELSIAQDILAYKARIAGVHIIIDRQDSFVVPVHPMRVHQLFTNLISNAIEACEGFANRGVVRISIIKQNDNTVIKITDNGRGIPPESIDKIFTKSFSTKKEGLGMGLMTVKTIVEDELRGHIVAKNNPDGGACFVITIPKYL